MIKNNMICLILCAVLPLSAAGTDYYVRHQATCTNTMAQSPFTNWSMAATNIQWVIDLAGDGDTITVSNGIYALDSTITIDSALTMQSAHVNTPELTVLDGLGGNRNGMIVSNASAVLRGFTIKNFGASAGWYGSKLYYGRISDCVFTGCYDGILVAGSDAVVSNCTAIASLRYGMAVSGSTNTLIVNSRSVTNTSTGVFIGNDTEGTIIRNCVISSNSNGGFDIRRYATTLIRDSDIIGNTRSAHGAGMYINFGDGSTTVVDRCQIVGNKTVGANRWGAGIYCHDGNSSGILPELQIRSSLIAYNETTERGAGITVLAGIIQMDNCTVASNITASVTSAGGIQFEDYSEGSISNTIVYYNRNATGPKDWVTRGSNNLALAHICTPAGALSYTVVNQITNKPGFVDLDGGLFQLRADSPCVNAGVNSEWMAGALDLDRHSRLDRMSGKVDVGCYEYIYGGSIFGVR